MIYESCLLEITNGIISLDYWIVQMWNSLLIKYEMNLFIQKTTESVQEFQDFQAFNYLKTT